jgi:hypothetical protein
MSENKKLFTVDVDGKELKLAVMRPNQKVQQQAQLIYSSAFREAVKPPDGRTGAIVRAALDGVLREQKLWDDAKQEKFQQLQTSLREGERKLARGKIKLSEAREVALQMRRDRWSLQQVNADRNSLEANTAESQAEQARFAYMVSACTVYADSGKAYYKNSDAYLASNDDVAMKAATAFGQLYYGLDEDFSKKLPENKFLLAYNFVREKDLHLIDKQGRLVDAEGHLVDEEGRFIDEQGRLVDKEGNLLTEDGDFKVEDFVEFEDDRELATAAS